MEGATSCKRVEGGGPLIRVVVTATNSTITEGGGSPPVRVKLFFLFAKFGCHDCIHFFCNFFFAKEHLFANLFAFSRVYACPYPGQWFPELDSNNCALRAYFSSWHFWFHILFGGGRLFTIRQREPLKPLFAVFGSFGQFWCI